MSQFQYNQDSTYPSYPGTVSPALLQQMYETSRMNLEQFPRSKHVQVSEWQAQIRNVFKLFQKDDLLEADDLGTALRALNLSPTVAQVNALKDEFENEYITYAQFETVLLGILESNRYHDGLIARVSEDVLIQAFETLDEEQKGFIETEKFIEMMKTMGEPMSEEEIAEMMHAAEDPDSHTIRYEDYIPRLLE